MFVQTYLHVHVIKCIIFHKVIKLIVRKTIIKKPNPKLVVAGLLNTKFSCYHSAAMPFRLFVTKVHSMASYYYLNQSHQAKTTKMLHKYPGIRAESSERKASGLPSMIQYVHGQKLYANNKDADQPAHPRSLISVFVVRCLDSIIPLLANSKLSRM